MSLTRNLEQAFLNNKYGESVDINSLPAVEKNNISILAEDMANAIADFITAQTFKITRMVAHVEMDEIKTASPIQGEVLDVDTQPGKACRWKTRQTVGVQDFVKRTRKNLYD